MNWSVPATFLGVAPTCWTRIGDRMLVTLDNLRKHRDGLAALASHLQSELDTIRRERDEARELVRLVHGCVEYWALHAGKVPEQVAAMAALSVEKAG